MGFFDSKSSKSGGALGRSDTFANNNAGAAAPVINLSDSRQSSGKYAINHANKYEINVTQTDYGAVGAAFNLADNALVFGLDALEGAGDALEASYDFANDALYDAQQFSQDSFDTSVDFAENAFNGSLNFAMDSNQRVIDGIKNAYAGASDAITSNLESALMFAETQSQPDKGIFSSSVKTLAMAGVAVVALSAWSKKRG